MGVGKEIVMTTSHICLNMFEVSNMVIEHSISYAMSIGQCHRLLWSWFSKSFV